MGLTAAITRYLFVSSEPEKADVILIPGCPFPEPMERAVRLCCEGFAPLLLPSGNCWIFHKSGERPQSECEAMAALALKEGVPKAAILREDKARHTLDNARLSRLALDRAGVRVQTAIICCQSFHARRCLKAYARHFMGVRLLVCPAPTRGFDETNWFKTPVGIFKVFTELLKCTGLFFFLIQFAKAK
jgi:uncharacterized SAM-binding protein YcdF (DUF218 family)